TGPTSRSSPGPSRPGAVVPSTISSRRGERGTGAARTPPTPGPPPVAPPPAGPPPAPPPPAGAGGRGAPAPAPPGPPPRAAAGGGEGKVERVRHVLAGPARSGLGALPQRELPELGGRREVGPPAGADGREAVEELARQDGQRRLVAHQAVRHREQLVARVA